MKKDYWDLVPETATSPAVLKLRGKWDFSHLEEIAFPRPPSGTSKQTECSIDATQLEDLDTSGAMNVFRLLTALGFSAQSAALSGFGTKHSAIMRLVSERYLNTPELTHVGSLTLVSRIGKAAVEFFESVVELIAFIGESTLAFGRLLLNPSLFRPKELLTQLENVCVNAIPIISLVTFLIGVVVAYLSAMQIRQFGANIFIVDGISLAMCRELSPIIGAIIIAGRSGSAFTAQLGTMKLNEEIDALQTLGLDPMQVLVLPRILALTISMPLLILVGDIMGILGGLMIAEIHLSITTVTFIERLQSVLATKSLIVGLVKAPVFALFIALIGCRMGLNVENNARSVGLHTTSTVVQSIVCVILLNAGFAILFQELGI